MHGCSGEDTPLSTDMKAQRIPAHKNADAHNIRAAMDNYSRRPAQSRRSALAEPTARGTHPRFPTVTYADDTPNSHRHSIKAVKIPRCSRTRERSAFPHANIRSKTQTLIILLAQRWIIPPALTHCSAVPEPAAQGNHPQSPQLPLLMAPSIVIDTSTRWHKVAATKRAR